MGNELGLLRSSDEGSTWQFTPLRVSSRPISFKGKLVVASGTNILVSDDAGTSWRLNARLPKLGYDADGNAETIPISSLHIAGGELAAVSQVPVWSDNGGR